MSIIRMTVNGKAVEAEAKGETLLAEFLRGTLGLTGTHIGCETSQCGACTIHLNGRAVKSCTLLAAQAEGAEILTIEGVSGAQSAPDAPDALHPMQRAFSANHGLQCGFCTPGMIMSALDMVRRYKAEGKTLDEAAIRRELEGNLCRCTGYHNIVKSIAEGARAM